ncbi:MAG TPA: hypothetical protein VIN07_13560 [Flavipsychrobacter sp.]
MKKLVLLFGLGIVISSVFPSCKRSYNCECTSIKGEKTSRNILATNRPQAEKNCDEYGLVGHCEIK